MTTAPFRLIPLTPTTVRITHTPAGATGFPPDRPWLKDVLLDQPKVPIDSMRIRIECNDNFIYAKDPEGNKFFAEAQPPVFNIRRTTPFFNLDPTKTEVSLGLRRVEHGIRLRLSITSKEIFYGFGERFDAFSRQSGVLNAFTRDAISLVQGRGETYSAIPFFLSSRGYGFLFLNSHRTRWLIEPDKGTLTIDADGPNADYILIYGPDFKNILKTYTLLTGRPPLLPLWAFGLWVTSFPQGHQDSVLAHVEQHRQRDIPLDALILDYHWEEHFHNFHWRKSLFPDPDRLIAGLNQKGVRLGLILTPFINRRNRPIQKWLLNKFSRITPLGLEGDDERALPEYTEGLANGYFAHTDVRWWQGSGGMLDFTNPNAAAWWNSMLHPLYAQGIAFVKNDDGEYLPENAVSAIGMSGSEYHNIYGFFYGKALFDGTRSCIPLGRGEMDRKDDAPSSRPMIYARSVWAGSQRYPALFLGDQKPTFECIRRSMRAALNLGLSGFAYWTADVFGLDGKTTPETHMRYAQWALLSPIARYFYRPPAIDDTRFPWSHSSEVEANFCKYAKLRYRLLPYWYTLAWEAYQTGIPIIRPMLLEYPNDQRFAEVDDQMMLGDRLLLAPVVEAGATNRRIILPEGVWYDFWSDQSWSGPIELEYPAPLDRLPILVRGGTILPLGPILSHIPDGHRFDKLHLHLRPPFPAEFVLYEDDGQTTAYQNGNYLLTQLSTTKESNRLAIRISPNKGSFTGQLAQKQVEIFLHSLPQPVNILVNGVPQDNLIFTCPTHTETLIFVE